MNFGFSFMFDDVQFHERGAIPKNKTSAITIDVNIDRKSLKGILLLFQNGLEGGKRNSEEFPNPKITNIKLQIGTSGKVYSDGYKNLYQWNEIFRHYVNEKFKNGNHSYMNIQKYYCDNKFALWIDFRATQDNDLHGAGKEQYSKQEIKMELTKENTGEGEYMMYIFIVADARIVMRNKKFGKLEL